MPGNIGANALRRGSVGVARRLALRPGTFRPECSQRKADRLEGRLPHLRVIGQRCQHPP